MKELRYDVAVIGAGVTGCAAARELSRWNLAVCVAEREEDVCSGTSKANSAIVHAGFDAEPGSLKARFNVEGNRMMEELSKELDFEFKRNGSLVLSFDPEAHPALEALYEKGQANGVEGLRIISGDEARQMEPNLTDAVAEALYAPTGGIVCPFGLTIALAENACDNGVEFLFNTGIQDIRRENGEYVLEAADCRIRAAIVVNAAGVYADVFHNMVSERKLHITPRKGDYCLLDKEAGGHVSHTIFQLPTAMGKGILVTPTVHGNLLLGPTAVDVDDPNGVDTTAAGLAEVAEKAALGVEDLPLRQVITAFAGLRAHEDGHEFIIEEVADAPGFFDCAGIESPGLSSAPAIGQLVAAQVSQALHLPENPDFCPTRQAIPDPRKLSFEARQALVARDPAYGRIICRCEEISEGEIREAIRRGARSLDGVKRRTRAGMGRCQGGFCAPRVMELLEQSGIPWQQLTAKAGGTSYLLTGPAKGAD